MNKKALFTTLGVMLAVMVTAVTLVFTVGPMISADEAEASFTTIMMADEKYFHVYDDGNGCYFSEEGQNFLSLFSHSEEDGSINGVTAEGRNVLGLDADEKVRLLIKFPSTLKMNPGSIPSWDDNFDTFRLSVIIPSSVEYIGEYGIYTWYVDTLYIESSADYVWTHWDSDWAYDFGCNNIIYDCNRTITFDTDGGNAIDNQTVCVDCLVNEPTAPTKDGYTFQGWYLNDVKYNFKTPITEVTTDFTLTAHWKAATNESTTNQDTETPTENNTEANVTNQASNNGAVAAVAGTTGGAAGLGTIGTILGVAISKKRKK